MIIKPTTKNRCIAAASDTDHAATFVDFGVVDSKGRTVGCWSKVNVVTFSESGEGYEVRRGHARNGERLGFIKPMFFTTLAEADAAVSSFIDAARAAAV